MTSNIQDGCMKIMNNIRIYILGVFIFCFCLCNFINGQKLVYLEYSETLTFDQKRLPDAQILKGNVRFKHDDMLMFCDSAYFYDKSNSIDAFGNVRFEQGDTLYGYGDILYYDGNTRLARVRNNVRLIHRETILTTDSLNYERLKGVAYYFGSGTIRDSINTLHSQLGFYTPSTNQAIFRKRVSLENSSFSMSTDTLYYNTESHIAKLVSPTNILYEGETTILSSNGLYNTETEQSNLYNRSKIIHQDGKTLIGDTILYNKITGFGKFIGHIEAVDTVQQATLKGNYCELYEHSNTGFVTDSALVIDWSQEDTTYMHADTIFADQIQVRLYRLLPQDSIMQDSVMVAQSPDTLWVDTAYQQMRAFHNVRVYHPDYQLVCDSLVYHDQDSVIILYHLPICWSNNSQMSADSIYMYLKNQELDYAHGFGNALTIQQVSSNYFNQMMGKEMKAFIREGDLRQVDVNGNAETIFYPENDDGSFMGVNRTQSSFVKLFLKEKKIQRVVFTTRTTGIMYPIDQVTPEQTKLVGFFWAIDERPTKPQDVFLTPQHTYRPEQQAVSAVEEEPIEEEAIKPRPKRNRKKAN